MRPAQTAKYIFHALAFLAWWGTGEDRVKKVGLESKT